VTRTLAALAAALVLVCAAPAHATVLAGGELDRGDDGAESLEATISNGSDSGEAFQTVRIELPGAPAISDVTTSGSSPASCAPGFRGTIQCQIPPPYLRPGESFVVDFTASPVVADESGASVFAGDAGPFKLVGPFPSKAPPIDADATIKAFVKKRTRAGDRCGPAKPVFKVALGVVCVARNRVAVRAFVVNPSETPLGLTFFGPGWVKRLRVPANGGGGFTRSTPVRKPGKLVVVNGADGRKTSLPMRLPAKPKRR